MERITFGLSPNEINTILYNLDGKKFKEFILDFDFENEKLTINSVKTFRVEQDHEFTYKFMKTKIKAIGGIKRLYGFILKASDPNDFWNNSMYVVLANAIKC